MPDWIIPHHDFTRIQHFYEGGPQGQAIPWNLWLRPLAYWLPFILALYLAMITSMVILRRQWVERERLVFPLVQVPLSMIQEDGDSRSLLKPFFRNPLMWVGFALPAILQSLNGLNHYFPFVPTVSLGASVSLFRDTIHIPLRISFQMIGFSYFVNPDIAFGLCFFYLLNTVQQGLFNILGFQTLDPVLGVYSAYTGSIVVHQGFGAILVLVLFGLWTARGHLKDVVGKALGLNPKVDDGDEILSYRTAFFLLLGSLAFMGVWLWKSGLPAWITPIYLILAFLLFIGITRVVAEGGLAFIFAPMIASDFVAAGFGTRALGPTGTVALAFTYIWASDILTFVMASCANGLKLVEETIPKGRRLVFWAMLVAIVATLGASIWAIIDLAYRYGGINTDQFFFGGAARYPFDNAAARICRPHGSQLGQLGLHGRWCRGYGATHAGAAALFMVALPSPGLSHQRRLRHHVLQRLFGLVAQDSSDEIRRSSALSEDQTLLSGPGPRPVRHRRGVVLYRLFKRHQRQLRNELVT